LSEKQRNHDEFLQLFKEGLASTDPNRIFEISQELNRLNREYFRSSNAQEQTLEVKVPA